MIMDPFGERQPAELFEKLLRQFKYLFLILVELHASLVWLAAVVLPHIEKSIIPVVFRLPAKNDPAPPFPPPQGILQT